MPNEKSYQTFERYFPAEATAYCYELWQREKFAFKISKSRKTKLGDYRYDRHTGRHQVSVNGDLNSYSFLITYLHEVAHLLVQKEYNGKVPPHGVEWKNTFTALLKPVASDTIFPEDILIPLLRYMKNPKASTVGDHKLYMALSHYNKNSEENTLLAAVEEGESFQFKGKTYIKLSTRRTRALCEEVKTRRRYLISLIASID